MGNSNFTAHPEQQRVTVAMDQNQRNIFHAACKNGDLGLLQNIYSTYPEDMDLELTFMTACSNGHLEISQWVFLIRPDVKKCKNLFEESFCWACIKGHLEVAKWLLQVKPYLDISYRDENAFLRSCRLEKLEICQWLYSIRPNNYILVIRNDEIVNYSVIPLEKRKWQKTKLLLLSHFKGKPKNLLYDLPLDLIRHIVKFI